MGTKYTGRLLLALILIMAVFPGCAAQEELPTIEQVLPPGYVEKQVPSDMFQQMTRDTDIGWIRCFDCEYDWNGLQGYLVTKLAELDYTESRGPWVEKYSKSSKLPEDEVLKLMRVYSSPSGFGHVIVMNAAYMRSIKPDLAKTTGDHIIMVGYDNQNI